MYVQDKVEGDHGGGLGKEIQGDKRRGERIDGTDTRGALFVESKGDLQGRMGSN